MSEELLKIEDLSVEANGKPILRGLDMSVKKGETLVILGPNGAGKSTLGNAIMGNPAYTVTGGAITFRGEDLLEMAVNERAKAGIFMSFQNPLEVPGLSLINFIRSAVEMRTGQKVRFFPFRKELLRAMDLLHMDHAYAERDLNVGFSGGEKKKAEILQLLMLKPSLAILDETDSGLDVDAVRTVSEGVREYQKDRDSALIIITHNAGILSSLHVDRVNVLIDGRIVAEGDGSLVEEIGRNGFAAYEGKA